MFVCKGAPITQQPQLLGVSFSEILMFKVIIRLLLLTGDTTGLNGSEPVYVDKKELQWFGATVVASRTKDYVVVSGSTSWNHEWMKSWSSPLNYRPALRITSIYSATSCQIQPELNQSVVAFWPGMVSQSSRNSNHVKAIVRFGWMIMKKLSRLSFLIILELWGYHRLGYCMAGFSAALPKVKAWVQIAENYFFWLNCCQLDLRSPIGCIWVDPGPGIGMVRILLMMSFRLPVD